SPGVHAQCRYQHCDVKQRSHRFGFGFGLRLGLELGRYGTLAVPGVGVLVNFQSMSALSLSAPLGRRTSEPGAVFESRAVAGVPPAKVVVPVTPVIGAAVITPP